MTGQGTGQREEYGMPYKESKTELADRIIEILPAALEAVRRKKHKQITFGAVIGND